MRQRPKFHPLHDDYYAIVIEDGTWLEYASTKQFGELFEWANYAELEIISLNESVYGWKSSFKETKKEIQKMFSEDDMKRAYLDGVNDSEELPFNIDYYRKK